MYQYARFKKIVILPYMAEQRATVLVRLTPALKLKLAELAKRERRSLSKQVEFLLEQSLFQSIKVKDVAEHKSVSDSSSKRHVK
jgi:hypothetical protein